MTKEVVDHADRIKDEIKANVDNMIDSNLDQIVADLSKARADAPTADIPVKIVFSMSKKHNVIILEKGVKIEWEHKVKRSDSTDKIQIDLDQNELPLDGEE